MTKEHEDCLIIVLKPDKDGLLKVYCGQPETEEIREALRRANE